jgi:hypothetical protein
MYIDYRYLWRLSPKQLLVEETEVHLLFLLDELVEQAKVLNALHAELRFLHVYEHHEPLVLQ